LGTSRIVRGRRTTLLAAAGFGLMTMIPAARAAAQVDTRWPQHSMDRPQPPVVDPGPYVRDDSRPADAVVLFDGHDLSPWRSEKDGPAEWVVKDGYFQIAPGTGAIHTARGFGDAQLHIEWSAPTPATGQGQERGNSGVILQGLYEVQVLDSYRNPTYADGAAGAVFGQYPPLVNPARPPGEWNVYDIVFRRPRFDAAGAVTAPARVTVFFNGVLVQNDVPLTGPTAYQHRPPYRVTPDQLPLVLQDHGFPVRFRNVWIRELSEERQ
jgi:3-keto-disaccharide hydrolase